MRAGLVPRHRRAHEVVALGPRAHLPGERAGPERRRRVGIALQREQRGAHEEEGADEGRDRVPGEAEHERPPARPEGERLPGPHRDPPEDLLDAEPREHTADEVVGPDRDAARGDDDVRLERARENAFERVLRVLRHAEALDVGARCGESGLDHDAVRLVDLARFELVARRTQLGAGDRDRDTGTPPHGHLADPAGGERGEARRCQSRAGIVDGGARPDVAALVAHVRTRRHGLRDPNAVVADVDPLDRDDRIGSLRDDAAGRDVERLALAQSLASRGARPRPWRRRGASRACRPPAGRSRPSTSSGTAAGRRARRRARRAPSRRPPPASRARGGGARPAPGSPRAHRRRAGAGSRAPRYLRPRGTLAA